MRRLLFDHFTVALLLAVLLATLLPAQGQVADVLNGITYVAIMVLFFLHGARLSRHAIVAGAGHWRLHLLVFALTFGLFPLLGLLLYPLFVPLLGAELYLGVYFLCALPATVQSAIAFTSIARGNLAAAVCSASASSLLGILITPLLVQLLLGQQGQSGSLAAAVGAITVQLLLPFMVGHLLRPWIGGWLQQRAAMLVWVDQGTILLVVYSAFAMAVLADLWSVVPWHALLGLLLFSALLLTIVLVSVWRLSGWLGFAYEDRITILFCGSKKSLATGVPMAKVLFPAAQVGIMLLPILIFHQLQLMVCAVIARRLGDRPD